MSGTQEASGPTGPTLLGGSISLNVQTVKVEPRHLQTEVKPLTQETLEEYWAKAAEQLDLGEMMKNGVPRLGEKPGVIEVDAQTTWFADEFKPHRTKVLESLREQSGMRMLECKVNQLFVEKDEVIYSPEQKYNAMLEKNGTMAEMRKLFPTIDF